MVIGVTMINVVPGEERSSYNEILKIDGVRDVFHVFGEYDFIVIIDVNGLSEINKTVDTIREIKGVTATKTIIGAEL
ncbi:AsnC family transcriptional regulator [Methanocella sp. CWC-04]|uniref:AsnC family transcriptional regulator n=1 Tax=Methanooceanicella nereidis TaxID=2052831 RepID=A0AAP2W6Q0_9EURY|nr:Lrp/AsnC ligand binding domain-containing protein [Methanocella sp. CWC-04]MCD1295573.1 AsnC family transcriptional regulator [Methanocella sp. CWC-04]